MSLRETGKGGAPSSARKVRTKGDQESCTATDRISRQLCSYETVLSSLNWDRPFPGGEEVLRRFSLQLSQNRLAAVYVDETVVFRVLIPINLRIAPELGSWDHELFLSWVHSDMSSWHKCIYLHAS